MKHYNHSLQYTLALDAVCIPLGNIVLFPDEFHQAELVMAAESRDCLAIGFISSINENTLQLTNKYITSLN